MDTVTIAASAWKLRPSAHRTFTPEAPHCTFSTTAPNFTSTPAAMCSANLCAHMHPCNLFLSLKFLFLEQC